MSLTVWEWSSPSPLLFPIPHILFLTRLFYSQMQLKPINTATSHLQYHWFPPHPQNRKPRQEGKLTLVYKTNLASTPQNGAKMARRPVPEGGDEREPNRLVRSQSSQPQLLEWEVFL